MTPPAAASQTEDSFPRQQARTQRFTLGRPRNFYIAADGSRILFLRSASGTEPLTSLWAFDLATASEHLVCDPRTLMGEGAENLPPEERARRERVREGAGGIVSYAADRDARVAVFALGGSAFLADMTSGEVRSLAVTGPALDPRPDPTGRRVAYVSGGALHVLDLEGEDRVIADEDDPDVTWGLAEFVAGEEMGRTRGHWWSPDGTAIAAARVDVGPVPTWYIADPAQPDRQPAAIRYPAAGMPNADVRLSVFTVEGSDRRVDVEWDREGFPYLARVVWPKGHPLTLLVQSRDQRIARVLMADPLAGQTMVLDERRSDAWLEIVPGLPALTADGRLAVAVEDVATDTRRLAVGELLTRPGLQVRGVLDVGAEAVVFVASEEPTEQHLCRLDLVSGGLERLTMEPGVHGGAAEGDVLVIVSSSLERPDTTTTVVRAGRPLGEIRSLAERSSIQPSVSILKLGARELRSVILLPSSQAAGSEKLPVLLDPYGGPHAQRVVSARESFFASQWFADQGFAVLVADGRSTPNRGLAWERAVQGDLASAVLEDQIDALHAAAEREPRLDLTRVAIRGWSFGGYVAALAVLRRPDIFHSAVAGAPVTDWSLYDTHYTERYLGIPADQPEAYQTSSLLEGAANLTRPLLLIHGLSDDNVVVAHTLRFSQALLEHGRRHSVLPLSGVTHMTPQEVVAENLLLLQVAFLRESLGISRAPAILAERATAD
jgi:dipeptidyl-peptidase-4